MEFYRSNGRTFGAATHVGLIRKNNEDCFLAEPKSGLWLIADGMGGHDAGEVASDIARSTVKEKIAASFKLVDAIEESHKAIKEAANNNIGSPNMGTTIVALKDFGDYYQISWVGDSRAYLWDFDNSSLTQLSRDHSFVQALYESGTITHEEMQYHPQKNVITQSLGVKSLDDVKVDTIQNEWSVNQRIILCSDGLSDLLADKEIKTYCRNYHNKSEQELVDALVNAALDLGGRDNITVQVISAPKKIPTASTLHRIFTSKLTIPALIVSLGGIIAFILKLFLSR